MDRDAKSKVAAACRVSSTLLTTPRRDVSRLTYSRHASCSVRKKIRADFDGRWGDRRQELVFIGEHIDLLRESLTDQLDACLLDDSEWSQWQKVMKVSEACSSVCIGGQAGTDTVLLLQSKRSLARKIDKLEGLFEDGWEDVRARVFRCGFQS